MVRRKIALSLCSLVFICAVVMQPCVGLSAEETESEAEQQPVKSAYPTFAGEVDSRLDWVRLKNNEWIAGILRQMRNERLYFHSKKFKEQDIDWDDVLEVHTTSIHTYVLTDGTEFEGQATISETEVHVETKKGTQHFQRLDLLSIVPEAPSEWHHWSVNLGLGAVLNIGNTESLHLNGNAEIVRRDSFTRLLLAYNGEFGAVDREANLNRHLGHLELDLYVYLRTVFMPIIAYVSHDEFQNIKLRLPVGPGVGGRIIKNSWLKWDLAFSVGYQYLANISVPAGEQSEFHDLVTPMWTFAEFKITGDVKLKLEWGTWLVPTSVSLTVHRGVAILEVKLKDDWLVLETSAVYNRNEGPQADEDSDVPKKDDLRFLLGFSLRIN